MKREKEIYKLGRKIMDNTYVPVKRWVGSKRDNTRRCSEVHYHKSLIKYVADYNKPIQDENGHVSGFRVKTIGYKCGQIRLRKARTCSEVSNFYGAAFGEAISSCHSSLKSSGFSNSIANKYASESPDTSFNNNSVDDVGLDETNQTYDDK